MTQQLSIIIPTFNENQNIDSLIVKIMQLRPQPFIIVVDDNSPDGTAQIVEKNLKRFPKLFLIKRNQKAGRGSAVLAGLKLAMQNMNVTHLIEMDADFSHDPRELPHILRTCVKADFVVASRYVDKSQIINWPLPRRIFSKLANIFARSILLVPVHDYTNGYRCYSRSALELIDLNRLEEIGYALLMEMLYRAKQEKLNIVEVPTVFVNRRRGKSNTTFKEILNALNAPLRIRIRHK